MGGKALTAEVSRLPLVLVFFVDTDGTCDKPN